MFNTRFATVFLVVLLLLVGVGYVKYGAVGLEVGLSMFVLGTVGTVTYKHPVSGTTPPTAIQAKHANELTALAVCSDSDTGFTITHNWGLSAAQLAALQPFISWVYDTGGTGPSQLAFLLASQTTNSVVAVKATGAGTGGTYRVTLLKPTTLIQ